MLDSLKDVCRKGLTIYILDAAGFFAGLQLSLPLVVTTESVIKEIRDRESTLRLEYSLSAGKVITLSPTKESLNHIVKVAKELGEARRLSDTDLELLALTYELKQIGCRVTIVSDDRSVQNIALELGVSVMGVKRPTLKRSRKYVYKCPVCGYESGEPGICDRCGTELVRVRKK